MNYKVFISPSIQKSNIGIGDYGTEESRMQPIGALVAHFLRKQGQITVYTNNPETMKLQDVIYYSNSLKVDAHCAIHSNAGGGKGTEVFYQSTNPDSLKLAELLYNNISPLSPGEDRGIKSGDHLGEIRLVKAPSALIELGFHDNPEDAEWIIKNSIQIAKALALSLCEYFGVKFQDTSVPRVIESDAPPFIKNGRFYAPFRSLIDAVGGVTYWDQENKMARGMIGGAEIFLSEGSPYIIVEK